MRCQDCKGSGRYVGFQWDGGECERCGGTGVEPEDLQELPEDPPEPEPEEEPEEDEGPDDFDDEVPTPRAKTVTPAPAPVLVPQFAQYPNLSSHGVVQIRLGTGNYYRFVVHEIEVGAVDNIHVGQRMEILLHSIQYWCSPVYDPGTPVLSGFLGRLVLPVPVEIRPGENLFVEVENPNALTVNAYVMALCEVKS